MSFVVALLWIPGTSKGDFLNFLKMMGMAGSSAV